MKCRSYAVRRGIEYEFMCKHLGHIHTSLQRTLVDLPPDRGIVTEVYNALSFCLSVFVLI